MTSKRFFTFTIIFMSLCLGGPLIAMEDDNAGAILFESNIVLKNGGTTDLMTLMRVGFIVRKVHMEHKAVLVDLIRKTNGTTTTLEETSPPILRKFGLIDIDHQTPKAIVDIILSLHICDEGTINLDPTT